VGVAAQLDARAARGMLGEVGSGVLSMVGEGSADKVARFEPGATGQPFGRKTFITASFVSSLGPPIRSMQ
jgi:hypothetical protein